MVTLHPRHSALRSFSDSLHSLRAHSQLPLPYQSDLTTGKVNGAGMGRLSSSSSKRDKTTGSTKGHFCRTM